MNKLARLMGLWRRTDKDGKVVPGLQGKIGQWRVLILENQNQRPGKQDPHYNLCIVQEEPKPEATGEREPGDDGWRL